MKQALPFLYFILFSCAALFAQEENFQLPDSLAYKTNKELIDLIKQFRYNTPKVAKVYAEAFHAKASAEQHTTNIIESYFYLANIADTQGEFTASIAYINKGIAKTKTIKDSLQGNILRRLYNLRGGIYGQYGKYEKAIHDFNISLQISEKNSDQKGINIIKINIALLEMYAKQYFESMKTYREMFRISTDTSLISQNSRNSIIIGMSENFLKTERLDSARIYLDLGLKESVKSNDSDALSYFYPYEALYYYHKNKIPKSLEILEKARKLISNVQTEEKRNIEVYYYMAQCYYALKDYKKAIKHIEKAFDIIRKGNAKNAKLALKDSFSASNTNNMSIGDEKLFIPYEYLYLLETLMQCYEALGDEENRDFYFEQYYPLKIESAQKNVRINNLIFKFHEAPRIALIEKLSKKEAKAEKKVKYLYYLLALVFVGLIIGAIFYRKKEQQKQLAYKALIEKISTLEAKKNTVEAPKNTTTKKAVTITDEKAQAILKGLEKFEAKEQYLDENCNLRFVAKKVKTNATYLSKIINTHKKISFNDYINDLRIQYTLKRLKSDSLFRAYSIKSIAQEVGYKSADSFTKHFKKQTSLYPSYYIKNLNKENT
ncbi:AraC family transcriptional regulator [Kordia algicida OT-1]|uniref:Quinolinate synthetase A n=1 Tax=Kordia algicida OT-1 TaxID=391587 RepID=A9DWW8_9FLAO|nr:AraC family transcriptional regulator [Kordia algicida]EDP95936.1 Quinolinate synthetase A [Kordia algicida OT-1]